MKRNRLTRADRIAAIAAFNYFVAGFSLLCLLGLAVKKDHDLRDVKRELNAAMVVSSVKSRFINELESELEAARHDRDAALQNRVEADTRTEADREAADTLNAVEFRKHQAHVEAVEHGGG